MLLLVSFQVFQGHKEGGVGLILGYCVLLSTELYATSSSRLLTNASCFSWGLCQEKLVIFCSFLSPSLSFSVGKWMLSGFPVPDRLLHTPCLHLSLLTSRLCADQSETHIHTLSVTSSCLVSVSAACGLC